MITPVVRGIYIADVKDDTDIGRHRATKHCVCVSVGCGLYLLINTEHREKYDDFLLKASEYDFLNGVDRFLACHDPKVIKDEKLIRRVGTLSDVDAKTMYVKIRASTNIAPVEIKKVLAELWASFRT